MKGVTVINHPLVQHNLTRLRDERTQSQEFRRVLNELALLMMHEATRSFAVKEIPVTTPVAKTRGFRLEREVVLVPILRAGLGMMDSVLQLIPDARVGFIGLKREETTLRAVSYHTSLPADLSPFEVILIDPMLATGGSAVAALDLLKEAGAPAPAMICIVAAPEGIALVEQHYPDVAIYTPVVVQGLNAHKYIVPGLGDFGDRLYATL